MKIKSEPIKPSPVCIIDTESGDHFIGKVEGKILPIGKQLQAMLEPMFKLQHPLDDSHRPTGETIMNVHHQCTLFVQECEPAFAENCDLSQTLRVLRGNVGGTAFTGMITFSGLESDRKKMVALEEHVTVPT